MMKICVVFILGSMIGCIAGGGTKVYWRVLERIVKYGDDLTLICKLNETLPTLKTSMRWYKGETLCSMNNQTSYNKYKAVIVPKGVKLKIFNLVPEDVNQTYHCEIGFNMSEKKILSVEMVFREKKIPVKSNQSLNDGNNTVVIVLSIIGLLVLVFLLFLWKRGLFRRCMEHLQEKQSTHFTDHYLVHKHQTNGNGPTQDQSRIENGEVIVLHLNGQSNGKRNSSLHESDDVVQNGEVKVPLQNGQSNRKRNSSLNESEDVVQNGEVKVRLPNGQWNGKINSSLNESEDVVQNGEVKVSLLNGQSNRSRNSSLNESEDVVQNGEVIVPLLNGQSNGKRNSSLNESEDVVQNGKPKDANR